ncbi:hypothetical protein PIB30_043155, partial [Stylosanthes scabra]|nr:hypothetical protein [Stylosanthes scabra]
FTAQSLKIFPSSFFCSFTVYGCRRRCLPPPQPPPEQETAIGVFVAATTITAVFSNRRRSAASTSSAAVTHSVTPFCFSVSLQASSGSVADNSWVFFKLVWVSEEGQLSSYYSKGVLRLYTSLKSLIWDLKPLKMSLF